jgi:hypothetical protein
MKTGPQPIQRFNSLKLRAILPFILVILVIILAAWFGYDNRKNNSNNSMAGWSNFTSQKYGFKFTYPPYWGTPSVSVTDGKVGKFYQIGFKTDPSLNSANKNLTVMVDIYSQDYVNILCAQTDCPAQATLDAKTIQKNIKDGAAVFIRHDSSSYASLNNVAANNTSTLTDVQIINVPKINASGAIGIYWLNSASNCPDGKFAGNSKTNCVTLIDYNSLSQALKSIKGL